MEVLRPLNGQIVVVVEGVEVRPGSKLHIPTNLKTANTVRGLVHAVSDGEKPCSVKPGDLVMFCPAAALSTVVNDKTYLFVDHELLLGVIENAVHDSNGQASKLVGVN